MHLRFAIAALLFCILLPGAAGAQQKVIGPLHVSAATAPAPTPVPLPLPEMATADYGSPNRVRDIAPSRSQPPSRSTTTAPQPATAAPMLHPVPAAAATSPSPALSPVNPRRDPQAAQGGGQSPAVTPVEIEERPRNAVAVFVGRSAPTNFTQIITQPWTTKFEDTAMVSLTYNRRLFTVIDHLDIEAELGIAKRFGEADEWEFNTGILLRWTWFPWNDVIRTTLGISVFGPSYATGISQTEKDKSGNDKGNRWLNFFAPELTFADPDNPELEFVFRLHHRSGIFGVYEGVDGGSTFISTGLRYRF
jgi:hypothetical protein